MKKSYGKANLSSFPLTVPVVGPSDVRVTQQDEGSLLIRWSRLSVEEAQGEVVGYQVTLTHNGSHTTHTVHNPWLEARGLLPGRMYTVRVAALTGAGAGPPSAPIILEAQGQPEATVAREEGGSVLYAPPQPSWLAYLLIPLVLMVLLGTLWYYLRHLRHKSPPSATTHTPDLYPDPSINMYSEHKVWRPQESDVDSSLSSSRLLRPDHLANEYAEPRVPRHALTTTTTTEPYATTALLAPPSPPPPWRHHSDDSGVQVNWSAILPPPPACPPPDPELDSHYGGRRARSTSSQYDNMGVGMSARHYGTPCDAASTHTYEAYSHIQPSDRFPTFNTLQGRTDCQVRVECHPPRPQQPARSNTH
ncbi:hypothetical protein Pmani_026460 [Petrolisthes manimaculis]|uniref:Fibronectin type-III domain-containing protein n=1 Tax=Petrolisthes manimaculis TaxID=1843537 RepID=A0AAE1TXE5_9EUCA|nr:hypothetical protein Pmani_026460 [Petrolisthes manimaculis]